MDIFSQYIQSPNSTLQLQAKKISVRGAIIGSIIFSITDIIVIFINSYLLEIDSTVDIIFIFSLSFYFIFLIIFGIASTYFPASILGVLLAKSLERDFAENRLTTKRAITKGAFFSSVAVLFVCIPLLVFDLLLTLSTGHGDVFVMLFRTVVASIIASFIGMWTGDKLHNQFIQPNKEFDVTIDLKKI